MHRIAWDIETCPRPYEDFSDAHQRRHKKEYDVLSRKDSASTADELKAKASGTHPLLGWICCISVVSGNETKVGTPRSWSAPAPGAEAELLRDFWAFVGELNGRFQWVTFNGKRFDVPFLIDRSLRHQIRPTRQDLLQTYPYKQEPHADLANLVQHSFYSLADLCDHLGVESPKGGFDGADVAPAVAEGRLGEVVAYCERDVVATLECAQRALAFL